MTFPILLTSFRKSREAIEGGYFPYSVAVYQPKGMQFPKLDFFDIRNEFGHWNRPRDFAHLPTPLAYYRDALMALYRDRDDAIRDWYAHLTRPVALCCWCPYDKAAQRQIVEHGSFVCHTEVIRQYLEDLGAVVALDLDRAARMKVLP